MLFGSIKDHFESVGDYDEEHIEADDWDSSDCDDAGGLRAESWGRGSKDCII